MPEIPVGRITFNIRGRDVAVPHDLRIPIPDELNSLIWTDIGEARFEAKGAAKERDRFRAKVHEMWEAESAAIPVDGSRRAHRANVLADLLRWLDEEPPK